MKSSIIKKMKFLALILLVSCSGQGDSGVGIIVNKPTLPASNLFPDFDSNFPDTAIDTTAESESALVRSGTAITLGDTTLQDVYAAFATRGNGNREARVSILTAFGKEIVAATDEKGIEISESSQFVTLSVNADLYEEGDDWQVEMLIDPSDSDYIRYYFQNITEGRLQATSVLKTDNSGTVVKLLFAFVDPTLLSAIAGEGHRVVALAVDATDSTNTLMVLRIDEYLLANDAYYVYQLHYQCNNSTLECIGEFLENIDGSLSGNTARVSWNEGTGSICLAQMDYAGGSAVVGTTYSFTGPDSPDDSEVSTGTCTLSTPHWGSHVFTTADLLQRYTDTDPQGGTALEYYGNGVSKTGWDSLTPALIDTWLNAEGF